MAISNLRSRLDERVGAWRRSLAVGALALGTLAYAAPGLGQVPASASNGVLALVISVLASLAVFFYGVHDMTAGLRAAAQDRLRRQLQRFTGHPVSGVVSGTIATALIGSSSIVTIITVGLVSSGLLAFENALGVVMGANIGTTMSSQIIAWGLSDYFGIVLIIGAVLRFLVKRGNAQHWGAAIMGVGFVFLGLEMLESAVAPVKHADWVGEWLGKLDSVWLGIGVGAVITAIIQSSSAMMGMVIVMASQGLIDLPTGIAIMMGAELGTCTDTLASTIGQSRAAVRTGVFHLCFNLFNVLVLLWFAEPLARLAVALTPGTSAGAVARQIANAHVAFNVIGVLLMLPFTRLAARLTVSLLPDRKPHPSDTLHLAYGSPGTVGLDNGGAHTVDGTADS